MTIAAKYEDGVFKPLEEVKLTEGTRVEVHVAEQPRRRPRPVREVCRFRNVGRPRGHPRRRHVCEPPPGNRGSDRSLPPMAYLIDSDVMVDFTRGNAKAADYLDSLGDDCLADDFAGEHVERRAQSRRSVSFCIHGSWCRSASSGRGQRKLRQSPLR